MDFMKEHSKTIVDMLSVEDPAYQQQLFEEFGL